MNDRKRLIELIYCAGRDYENYVDEQHEIGMPAHEDFEEWLADDLLESGVIVPPCKVGDKIYKLCSVNSNIKMGQMWDGKIVNTNCDRCGYRNCSCYNVGLRELDKPYFINVIEEITVNNIEFLVRIMPYFNTIYFTDKEQAAKVIKECEEK